MFNGSGIITQAMSPKSSENEQRNGFKGKRTFHKLWVDFFFFFFDEETNFTADEVEIRQYCVQQAFHAEVLSFITKNSIYLRLCNTERLEAWSLKDFHIALHPFSRSVICCNQCRDIDVAFKSSVLICSVQT